VRGGEVRGFLISHDVCGVANADCGTFILTRWSAGWQNAGGQGMSGLLTKLPNPGVLNAKGIDLSIVGCGLARIPGCGMRALGEEEYEPRIQ
jgi:hypothetical protein